MKSITSIQAQQIIDSFKTYFRVKLAKLWGSDIVLGNTIVIEEDLFYYDMRNQSSPDQKDLFDEIFGPCYTMQDLKVGETMIVEYYFKGEKREHLLFRMENGFVSLTDPELIFGEKAILPGRKVTLSYS